MIPVFKPSYGKDEINAVSKVLLSGWAGLGPRTEEFEKEFAKYIGVKYAIALNSCTAALHLAMKVMDIEKGEVITTPITFVSTNHAIFYNGARPVFCDVEEDTLNIDVNLIETLITDRTKAVITVHYGGHSCDMKKINVFAKKHDLKVIEDCAHAAGGTYKGKKLGSIGDIGCFSFHAVKNLATGEGGMITTNDRNIYERLRKLRWLGISKGTWQREKEHKKYDWQYDVEEIGFKYHLHDISSAIGLAQLARLDDMNKRRREIVRIYSRELKGIGDIIVPSEKNYAKSAWHNFVIKTGKRDGLNVFLQEKGVSTGVHYYPNHLYEIYKPYYRNLPVAERIWKNILTLPLYPDLKDKEVLKIINHIKEFFVKQ